MADIPQAVIDTLIAEAAGEGPEGMRRVAETILNRAAIRGLSPEQVVTQRHQYTGYSNPGPAARRAQTNAETRAAAEAAFRLAMEPGDPTGGADHYYAPGTINQPRWASSMTPTGEYGGHAFFSSRPIPPGEIPNVVASLTDTVPPRPPTPVTMTPDLSLLRNPQMSAEARQAQVTPSGNVPLPRPRPQQMDLHPFDPNNNTPRPNADGSISTELTRTVQLEDGSWTNVPSLWWGSGSSVRDFGDMSDDELANLSTQYERQSGQKFPRYKDLTAAESAAVERSAEGGGTHGGIARPELPRPAQNGVVRGSAIADSIGRNPIPGGKQTSPMFDAAYDTRTGQMRMMPAPMATAGMAFAATPAPAPIPAQQTPQMAGLRSRDQGLQAALDQRYPQQATQYPPMRLPEIPPSNLGQPPITRSVPSIPMNMAPTQAEIDRAPGQVIATYPTTARPMGSAATNIRDQRSEQMAQRPPLIPDRLTPGTAAQNYDVARNGPAGLTRQQFAALPGQMPFSQQSMLPRIAAPMPLPATMRPRVQMPVQQAARPQVQRPQYSPLRVVVQGGRLAPSAPQQRASSPSQAYDQRNADAATRARENASSPVHISSNSWFNEVTGRG